MAEPALFADDQPGRFGSSPEPFKSIAPPPVPRAATRYELRPLTTGELLDRTFFLYRSNFWLFVGLASIAAGVNVGMELLKLVYQHFFGVFALAKAAGPGQAVPSGLFALLSVVSSLLSFAVYGVTQAATTSAVSSIYLGDETSLKGSLDKVAGRWARFFGISIWQIWGSSWIFVLLIVPPLVIYRLGLQSRMGIAGLFIFAAMLSLVYGMIAFIRNSFAVPAAVMEGLKVREAMRRSKTLTSGTKGRIFLLFLFMMVLYLVVSAVQAPLVAMLGSAKGSKVLLVQAAMLFVGFLASSVVGPVGAVGLCLFYIDQRIRKEGFDIEFLIERSGSAVATPGAADSVELP